MVQRHMALRATAARPGEDIGVARRGGFFQTVVARASRPCVGCTIRTGGTPVPLRWKRPGRRNFVCLSTCRACEWLNTYISSEIGMSCRPGALTGRLFQQAANRPLTTPFSHSTRRKSAQILWEKQAPSEPTHVGCYFINGLLTWDDWRSNRDVSARVRPIRRPCVGPFEVQRPGFRAAHMGQRCR